MPEQGSVLVTGGAGYIGSHTCVALLRSGRSVVVVDDFSNSSPTAMERVAELAPGPLQVVRADIGDRAAIDRVLSDHEIDSVVHFAGFKAVGESLTEPLRYYANNVGGTVNLLSCLRDAGVRNVVFSSSATVYGDPEVVPITETAALAATNPYGRTKLHIEDILRDLAASEDGWRVLILRYFNPVGAHPSGRIGEDPKGTPNNLMPFVMQVAVGRRPELVVFGDDYPTPDGTCVRDYIHVDDLAEGHVAALEHLDRIEGAVAVNLGTGHGSSVLEVVRAAEAAVGASIPRRIGPRRAGDVAASFADASLAQELLGWKATRTLDEMCADNWRWQQGNPHGYGD